MDVHIIRRSTVQVAYDPEPADKRIGLIVLSTDHVFERDFARMCPAEVAMHATRIAYDNPTTPENLRRMQPRLAQAAALILPDEPLDAICYGCTSASMVLGDHKVISTVHEGKPGVPVTNPALAARLGLGAVGARRISVLTPYLPQTSVEVARYFSDHGFEVLNLDYFGLDDDRKMARVKPSMIIAAAERAAAPHADALFISCTAVRSAEVAGEIEARIGRPVLTSNQTSVWLTLRRAGVDTSIGDNGRLMTLPAPP